MPARQSPWRRSNSVVVGGAKRSLMDRSPRWSGGRTIHQKRRDFALRKCDPGLVVPGFQRSAPRRFVSNRRHRPPLLPRLRCAAPRGGADRAGRTRGAPGRHRVCPGKSAARHQTRDLGCKYHHAETLPLGRGARHLRRSRLRLLRDGVLSPASRRLAGNPRAVSRAPAIWGARRRSMDHRVCPRGPCVCSGLRATARYHRRSRG